MSEAVYRQFRGGRELIAVSSLLLDDSTSMVRPSNYNVFLEYLTDMAHKLPNSLLFAHNCSYVHILAGLLDLPIVLRPVGGDFFGVP